MPNHEGQKASGPPAVWAFVCGRTTGLESVLMILVTWAPFK